MIKLEKLVDDGDGALNAVETRFYGGENLLIFQIHTHVKERWSRHKTEVMIIVICNDYVSANPMAKKLLKLTLPFLYTR